MESGIGATQGLNAQVLVGKPEHRSACIDFENVEFGKVDLMQVCDDNKLPAGSATGQGNEQHCKHSGMNSRSTWTSGVESSAEAEAHQ